MAVTDESRYRLHQRLEEVLGTQEAATLMAQLRPDGWADVATKRDLDQLAVTTKRDLDGLEERVGMRFESLGARMATMSAELRHEFQRDLRVTTLGSAGLVVALVALIETGSRLI